jgi:hypothetical protein
LVNAQQFVDFSLMFDDALRIDLFSTINCFDYSDFCTHLNVLTFPSLQVYKDENLVKKMNFLPSNDVLLHVIKK